tara:strand:- start:22138 stop:22746 length:609 start_codon:yes stop_codon:yes gene_type:complete
MKLADFETLSQAKAHTEKRGVILNANDMGVLFDKHPGTLAALEAVESQNESVKIFLTLFRSGGGRYDFREKPTDIEEVTDGEQLKTKMQQLVEAGVVSAAFANDVFNTANPVYYPHANATEYDFKRAKGLPIAQKEVAPVSGYIKTTLTQDVEPHRPQVYVDIQGVKQRITGFGLVDKAGDYLAQVPRGYASFYVDDAYGVM